LNIGDAFGRDCALLGDLNGDGFSEYGVGAENTDTAGFTNAGSGYVFSGIDGTLLYEFLGEGHTSWMGGVITSAGDLDCDGVLDILTSAIGDGVVYAYSGATGDQLLRVTGNPIERFGWSLAAAGDLNHDGHDDFLVGAYFANTGIGREGAVYAYSGVDGTELLRIEGQVADARLGFAIDGGEDVNGDGTPDILVSSTLEDDGARMNVGAIRAFSGIDGSEVLYIKGVAEGAAMGGSLSWLPDVNGDNVAEVLSGTSGKDVNSTESGAAFVHCGLTGDLVHRIDGFEFEQGFGTSCASIGDLTGDGYADFAIGSDGATSLTGVEDAGRIDCFSGRDGRLIRSFFGETRFGFLAVD